MFKGLKKIFGEQEKNQIFSPLEGIVIPMADVADPTFSQEILGKGVAVIPKVGKIVAPADGVVEVMFETKHAVSIKTDKDVEVIVHVGLDTVNLKGQYYTSYVQAGDRVKTGDLLIEFDISKIKEAGYDVVTPVVICNSDSYPKIVCHTGMEVKAGDIIIDLD